MSALGVLFACAIGFAGQVPGDRLRNAAAEARNWLTYAESQLLRQRAATQPLR